jgi:hypothetical protein
MRMRDFASPTELATVLWCDGRTRIRDLASTELRSEASTQVAVMQHPVI